MSVPRADTSDHDVLQPGVDHAVPQHVDEPDELARTSRGHPAEAVPGAGSLPVPLGRAEHARLERLRVQRVHLVVAEAAAPLVRHRHGASVGSAGRRRSVRRPPWQTRRIDSVRIDQWIWGVRLFPTRAAATAACKAGHVRVNDTSAKPSTPVRVGDRVCAQVGRRLRDYEVVRLVDKRVGAKVAIDCIVDHSPPPPPIDDAPAPQRDRGTGRPTKRDRRRIDRLRGR